MSRNVTLLQLRTRTLRRADMVTSSFVTASEVNDVINDELCELYDLLVAAAPPDYYYSETTVTTAATTIQYALPADFRSLIAVYANEGGGQRRPISPVKNEYERAFYTAPGGTYSVILAYVPAPTILAADGDVFDGVSGWESLVTARAAKRLLAKRKADTSEISMEIAEKTQEIRTRSRRDIGHPRFITDVDGAEAWLYPNSNLIRGFLVRGGNLELYQPVVPYP